MISIVISTADVRNAVKANVIISVSMDAELTPVTTRAWVSIITARCYASAVLAMGLCLSVSVSVCLSHVVVLLKRLNRGSHKQHHTIAQGT